MKKQAFPVIRTLSPFFATAAAALTFVSAPISIDTAKAQQPVTEQEDLVMTGRLPSLGISKGQPNWNPTGEDYFPIFRLYGPE
jgi:hypothetical protein